MLQSRCRAHHTGLTILILLLCGCVKTDAPPEIIPRDILFGNPERVDPQISPDGSLISFRAPYQGVMNLWIQTRGEDDARPLTLDTETGVQDFLGIDYFWGVDSQHILYLKDTDGDEDWHLYSVHLGTKEVRDLTPFEGIQVQVLNRDKNFPDELLIDMNKDNPRLRDVYRVDLSSGHLTRAAVNPGDIRAWFADADFKVRAALKATDDGGLDLLARDSEQELWRVAVRWKLEESENSYPVGFAKDRDRIYLIDSRHTDTARLVSLNLVDGEIEVVYHDPEYDAYPGVAFGTGNIIRDLDDYGIQAIRMIRERAEWEFFDASFEADMRHLQETLKGDLFITSRSDDDRIWILGAVSDVEPAVYYLFDRDSGDVELLFESLPALRGYQLARTEAITFTARDGLTIHGYITFPPGMERSNLPMVVHPHGGPWHRDTWGFDPEVQWMANRGYVCLQVNFRGSTSYGKDFINAAIREWGGKMHEDILDGIAWAVDRGYVDPDRVAIYGGSYGGYATLVGATFTPEHFRCAISLFGPSNILTLFDLFPAYWSTRMARWYARVGHPEEDRDFLRSRSPLFHVDNLSIPLMVVQGANDVRVTRQEAEQIVDAMKMRGLEYEYLLFDDEGHGIRRPENRETFYAAAERFLARHLGGRIEE